LGGVEARAVCRQALCVLRLLVGGGGGVWAGVATGGADAPSHCAPDARGAGKSPSLAVGRAKITNAISVSLSKSLTTRAEPAP
jgi:hypothetical protein